MLLRIIQLQFIIYIYSLIECIFFKYSRHIFTFELSSTKMKEWSVQNDNMSYVTYYCNSKSTSIVCSGL